MYSQDSIYIEQIQHMVKNNKLWDELKDKTILISGATGMIGTYLIDLLLHARDIYDLNIKIIALGRSETYAQERFGDYMGKNFFHFVAQDVNEPIQLEFSCDYVIHAASNTHPRQYASDPVGTIATNIIGTKNLLDYAVRQKVKRFVFLSSVEVYGENRGDVEEFDESYLGYIDCNTLRAGYPESKRVGESLCQAYRSVYGMEIVTARLSRTYGPTMRLTDSKAIAQFIQKAVAKENIILKSEGTQLFSYSYALDAAMAVLFILLRGKDGEAYNVADERSNITLRDLAWICAGLGGKNVIFDLPDMIEAKGYSKASKALMSVDKLRQLGWENQYEIKDGLRYTVEMLGRD